MYHVRLTSYAEDDLARLSKTAAQQVLKRLRWLAENIDEITPESLTGQWQGVFKLRVGDFRILYTFDRTERNIIVHVIRHRREVYKAR